MKKKYETPIIDLIVFEEEDIITLSTGEADEVETKKAPGVW